MNFLASRILLGVTGTSLPGCHTRMRLEKVTKLKWSLGRNSRRIVNRASLVCVRDIKKRTVELCHFAMRWVCVSVCPTMRSQEPAGGKKKKVAQYHSLFEGTAHYNSENWNAEYKFFSVWRTDCFNLCRWQSMLPVWFWFQPWRRWYQSQIQHFLARQAGLWGQNSAQNVHLAPERKQILLQAFDLCNVCVCVSVCRPASNELSEWEEFQVFSDLWIKKCWERRKGDIKEKEGKNHWHCMDKENKLYNKSTLAGNLLGSLVQLLVNPNPWSANRMAATRCLHDKIFN